MNVTNAKFITTLNKNNIRRLIGVLTGHCTLNKHLHKIGLHWSPICDKCGGIESAAHFLCHCPAYITARRKILGRYILPSNSIWRLHPKSIINYLNSTNRLQSYKLLVVGCTTGPLGVCPPTSSIYLSSFPDHPKVPA